MLFLNRTRDDELLSGSFKGDLKDVLSHWCSASALMPVRFGSHKAGPHMHEGRLESDPTVRILIICGIWSLIRLRLTQPASVVVMHLFLKVNL